MKHNIESIFEHNNTVKLKNKPKFDEAIKRILKHSDRIIPLQVKFYHNHNDEARLVVSDFSKNCTLHMTHPASKDPSAIAQAHTKMFLDYLHMFSKQLIISLTHKTSIVFEIEVVVDEGKYVSTTVVDMFFLYVNAALSVIKDTPRQNIDLKINVITNAKYPFGELKCILKGTSQLTEQQEIYKMVKMLNTADKLWNTKMEDLFDAIDTLEQDNRTFVMLNAKTKPFNACKIEIDVSELQDKCAVLQDKCDVLQDKCNKIQSDYDNLLVAHNELQVKYDLVMADNQRLMLENKNLNARIDDLLAQLNLKSNVPVFDHTKYTSDELFIMYTKAKAEEKQKETEQYESKAGGMLGDLRAKRAQRLEKQTEELPYTTDEDGNPL